MRIHVMYIGGSIEFDSKFAKFNFLDYLEINDGKNIKFEILLSSILIIWQMKNYWDLDKVIWKC